MLRAASGAGMRSARRRLVRCLRILTLRSPLRERPQALAAGEGLGVSCGTKLTDPHPSLLPRGRRDTNKSRAPLAALTFSQAPYVKPALLTSH